MNESKEALYLKGRTEEFALQVIKVYAPFSGKPKLSWWASSSYGAVPRSVAHYREAQRARSSAEFIRKFEGGMQELEETLYWLELLEESGIVEGDRISILQKKRMN